MDFTEFRAVFEEQLKLINIQMEESQYKKFYNYMNLLIEWNKKINLTAIIEPKEIILKHFIDSLSISKYIEDNSQMLDVGTGAGFPGIPLKIVKPQIKLTLLDSLNKRILFLEEVLKQLKITDIFTIHGRAEDLGRNKEHRGKYDVVVSRAVAQMNVLLEYMLPFTKIGGICICMKGPNIGEELANAQRALKKLGGETKSIETMNLVGNVRKIIIIEKIKETPFDFPRKAGMLQKCPI